MWRGERRHAYVRDRPRHSNGGPEQRMSNHEANPLNFRGGTSAQSATQTRPCVLALTLLDSATLVDRSVVRDSKVRICVRSREVNITHPDVVSVPTQRLPASLAKKILDRGKFVRTFGKTDLMASDFVSSRERDGSDPIIYAVESLLCRKHGVADQLENNELVFEAALAGHHDGTARYPNLGRTEDLRMINVRVHILEGQHLFPSRTSSYRFSSWASVHGFEKMWGKGKDVTHVGLTPEDAFGVCVDGLCISSTYDILASEVSKSSNELLSSIYQPS